MSDASLILLAVFGPLLGAVGIRLTGSVPNMREAVTLITAGILFFIVLSIYGRVDAGAQPEAFLFNVLPGIDFGFRVEPLGMLFALIASGLWIVNSIYSIGYMRGNQEPRQTTFYVCFAIAISSAIGIAFAANLFTLFIFYEVLTLATYPLVAHKGNEEARRGARVYITLLLVTSTLLLLPAIVWTFVLAGTSDFAAGGILAGKADGLVAGVLLALYAFGIGKAALMPIHFWLPNAMVAPTPVSALLHAVAVVKAGVFSVLKIIVYVFGIDFLTGTGQNDWLVIVAGGTVVLASLIAMTKDNLKARLAYSTVSQLSYIVLGAADASTLAVAGGAFHIATHAVGKITLFFCAGAIYTAVHKTEISQMAGLGRVMPVTFTAFTIAALSIIGLPPMAGTWSKWYLALGAMDAGQLFAVAVLMLSSLLNIAYLMPIPLRGFLGRAADRNWEDGRMREAPVACLIALSVTAGLCLLLFFFPDPTYDLISKMALR